MNDDRPRESGEEGTSTATQNLVLMVQVTITKFTGVGRPIVVVGAPRTEPQSEPSGPALRLIRGGAT